MSEKVYVKTYGCQMNVYDSNRMTDILAPLGYSVTETPDDADLLIFNTCHIREKATEKLYSDLGRVKHLKGEKPITIAVAGCTAQAEGGEIFKRASYVDMVFGPQSYHELPEMLARVKRQKDSQDLTGNRGVLNVEFPEDPKFDHLPAIRSQNGFSEFVAIQEGCDKFCHFCVVPYTRGAEYSRPVQQVLDDIKRLEEQGVKEVTLLGQNVNGYHGLDAQGNESTLGRLIEEIAKFDGIQTIRYMTSHPRDVDDSLIAAHRDIEKLSPFLHLPVQSGSDIILKAMNRKHTREFYLGLIDKFRKARPDMAFSSDFIVGYPGEKDQDFQQTLDLVREVSYAQSYSFKYSPRPGTPAWTLEYQVPEDVKDARLQELQTLILSCQKKFNERLLNQTMRVLFEKKGKLQGQILGKSPYMQSVHVIAPERLIGHYVDVKIMETYNNSLTGTVVTSDNGIVG